MYKLTLLFFFIFSKNVFAFSTSSILLRANIEDIKITTSEEDDLEVLMHEQLRYLTGNFLEYDAGFSVGNIELKIINKEQIQDKIKTTYNANFNLLWPKERKVPSKVKVILPNYGDFNNLSLFLKRYEQDCSYKVNGQLGSFWSYIRPSNKSCRLYHESGQYNLSSIYDVNLNKIIQPKFPSKMLYNFIRDKLFKATIVLGRVKKNYQNGPSYKDYKNLKKFLIEKHKNVIYSELKYLGEKGEIFQDTLVFEQSDNKYEYNFFIVNDFSQETIEAVDDTLKGVDYFSYNGHAGMGVNITSIGKNSKFDFTKPSVIFLNSCITYGYFTYGNFSHFENSLIILNSIQNHFGTFYKSNQVIIEGLIDKGASYESILNRLPIKQRSLLLSTQQR